MDISKGVNSVSEEEVLARLMGLERQVDLAQAHVPHANEVLHHELMEGFCRMRHVYFAFAVPEVRLWHMSCAGFSEMIARTFSIMYVKAAAWSR